MKESIFNKYIHTPDGEVLAFNSLSCGLAIIDNSYNEILSMLPCIKEPSLSEYQLETYKSAIAGGFLVPDEFDELGDLKTKINVHKYDTTYLNLTIAPTLLCNFKCIYCYEENKSGIMSDLTENSLINFLKRHINTINNLNINWYGGEPLIAIKNIASLSEKFIDICSEYNVIYTASMITNGSLINQEIIATIKKYKIKEMQITLDGPPHVHEARRVSNDNKINFYTILDNINKLIAQNINITIRINIDKTNENYLEHLISILDKKLIKKNIEFSFGQVRVFSNTNCLSIINNCFNNYEFSRNILEYYSLLKKYDLINEKSYPYPYAKYNYCTAELLNSYVIDPLGFIYKCWNSIGNKEYSIGNINDNELDLLNYKHGAWICIDKINKKCETCNILPLCLGGCQLLSKKNNNPNCDLIKYNIDDIFLRYYNHIKEESK